MCPMVNTEDLCDAHEVAALLGLSHPNSVFGYLRRYADMPRPVVTAGRGKIALWLRPDVEAWCAARPRRQAAPMPQGAARVGPQVGPSGDAERAAVRPGAAA